jgi:hypothetical protein
MAVLGPPGGVGDEGLEERVPPSDPEAAPVGEVARGEEDIFFFFKKCEGWKRKKKEKVLEIDREND